MRIIERGSGAPLVLIPGIQGRWEYMRPAIDRLAASFRVITFSLCGEPSSSTRLDSARGMDAYADQVGRALDHAGLDRAPICGVSFGGLVALRFAAREPQRTSSLIMVSTPGPTWHLKRKHEIYARLPWIFGPVFLAESPARLRKEIAIAVPDPAARRAFVRGQLKTLLGAPVSVSRLARRARLIGAHDRLADCAAVSCRTLIVHGEPRLDHVVPATGTSEYSTLIRGAHSAQIDRTGHLGSITRPDVFAGIVGDFVRADRRKAHDSAA